MDYCVRALYRAAQIGRPSFPRIKQSNASTLRSKAKGRCAASRHKLRRDDTSSEHRTTCASNCGFGRKRRETTDQRVRL
jgi:hypothetical protein